MKELVIPRKTFVSVYLPMGAALAIALTSFVTLAAYDQPLDRHALTPSILECADTWTSMAMPAPDTVPARAAGDTLQAALPDAHAQAMLLRFELPQSKVRPPML